jgi:cell wall-associated NlpC family hydrolase
MLRRGLVVLAMAAGALSLLPVAMASAATPPVGRVTAATQDTFTHKLTVRGWADDPLHPAASVLVQLRVDGHYAKQVRADLPSPWEDAHRNLTGQHAFRFAVTWTARATSVAVAVVRGSAALRIGVDSVRHVQPGPGARIVIVAKQYVGRARYVEGGASPTTGFDCSGYTQYVYAQAHVATLPHNADAQRRMAGMHLESRAAARPGDLVFYLSGGAAYHVAIYAGHGMQYAAATPRDGIRYQAVWSSAVQYGTDWH